MRKCSGVIKHARPWNTEEGTLGMCRQESICNKNGDMRLTVTNRVGDADCLPFFICRDIFLFFAKYNAITQEM